MLPADLTEAQIYRHAHQLLNDHEKMLADKARNRAFYQALEAKVRADSVVLDIGAGFGVWAITAAKLGAKRVVALDSNELLLGVIQQLSKECGVADRVQTICGYSTTINLPREFDLVVSEIIGFDGFDEAIVAVMRDARRRFLKPAGLLIPESLSLWCAGVRWSEKRLPQALPFEFASFATLNRHAPLRLHDGVEVVLQSQPIQLISANLYSAEEPVDLTNLKATWTLDDAASEPLDQINGVLVWVQSQLSPDVSLSTRDTTSWTPVLYRFENGPKQLKNLTFTLAFAPETVRWGVIFDGMEPKQYSPQLAAKHLLHQLRDSQVPVSALGSQLIDALLSPQI
jgi:type I protein arginine methyltransferase